MSAISYIESPLKVYPHGYTPTLEEVNRDQPKMLSMNPSRWKKGFQKRELPWESMHYMVNSDYRIYSAGFFTNGIATDDNWYGQDFFILDIDDGLSISEAKQLFSGYRCLITTTKSHQVDKHGIVCDRFRVIMPTTKPITCTAKEYSGTMKLIQDIDYPFADKKCKDASRIYFGFSGAVHIYLEGKAFDFEKYLSRMQKKKVTREALKHHIQPKRTYTQRNAIESTHKGFYERVWCTPEMLTALKFDEKFISGNRNNALLSWTKFFKDIGFSDSEVREVIFYINSVGDSVTEKEIETTIFRSQRIQ